MQAVSGTQRAWLIFSGLAFVLCGALLVVRFSRSAPTAALAPAAPAAAASTPVITEQFTVSPKQSDGPAKIGGAAAPGTADKVTAGLPSPPVKVTSPSRPKKRASAPRSPAHRPGAINTGAVGAASRGLDLNGGDLDAAPAPSAPRAVPRPVPSPASPGVTRKDRQAEGAPPPPPSPPPSPPPRAKTDEAPESKSPHGKIKRHRPAPAAPEEEAAETRSDPAPAPADKLVEGVLRVNAPSTMTVGESEHIRAVVGTKARVEQVDKDAAAEVGDGPRVQLGRELPLSPLVRMELKSDVPGDFDITAFAPQAEQRLTDSDTTVWDWAVQPKREGLRGLTLVVTDLKEPSREPIRSKIYPVHIEVRVATFQKVHDLAVSVSSLLSGLAGLIGAWMGILRPALQRRREGEGGGAPRSPLSGTAPPRPHAGAPGQSIRPEVDPPSGDASPHP